MSFSPGDYVMLRASYKGSVIGRYLRPSGPDPAEGFCEVMTDWGLVVVKESAIAPAYQAVQTPGTGQE
jgi:hypothetical protein